MDKRQFNGGKRDNAGRKKKYEDPADITVTVELVEKQKAVKKAGGIGKLKLLINSYIREIGEKE